MRHTKIVATLGPATRDLDTMTRLIEAGADVLRLNFSHGEPDQHDELIATARSAAERAGREVGLLGDLPGPKLRVGDVAGDVMDIPEGGSIVLTTGSVNGSPERLSVSWEGLPEAVGPGDTVFLADGSVRLRVQETSATEVACIAEVGGPVASHQGLNLPGVDFSLPAVGSEDLGWLDFALDNGLDLIAVSFVRSPQDLVPIRERLAERGADTPVIAKIEKPQAAENAEEIVKSATGGIMVARGDLGIELPIETVPLVQKRLIALAGRYSKPSITATQMLASMVNTSRPTRAEASDVANAIFDGTDAVMLSEETAIGRYPIAAVRTMDRIARETERELPYGDWLLSRTGQEQGEVANSITHGAVGAVYRLGLSALVVPTRSGRTARLISAHRPRVPVLALSPTISTVRRLNLLWGVRPVLNEEEGDLHDLLGQCADRAKELGVANSDDLIAITAGLPEQKLGTNLFEVHRVP